jgi:dTMP kinase
MMAGLARRLSGAASVDIVLTKEPTPAFDLSREQRLRGVELAAAIADDRRHHVNTVIAPALASGRTVVCDRYILSSYVFHTADGVPEKIIEELNSSFPRPTLNLILRVPAAELRRRRLRRATTTRLQREDVAAEMAAYLRYADVMELTNTPSRVVDNSTMADHHRLLGWLCALCTGGPR